MAVLVDIGRHTALIRLKETKRPRRGRRFPIMSHSRHLRTTAAQTDPNSQSVKSAGTWPESISSFFRPTRQPRTPRDLEVIRLVDGGDQGPPPNRSDFDGQGDRSEEPDGTFNGELLNLAEAESLAAEKGVHHLPGEFLKAAKTTGLRATTLKSYLHLQGLMSVGFLVRRFPWIRDRLIADSAYLFKVITEVAIDSGCCTLAEVRKRGSDFFNEFEFYLSDMIVGLVLDVALVSLLAPVAVIGVKPLSASKTGLSKYLAKLPSALFEANIKGVREYTLSQRVVSFFYKAAQYAVIGFFCGLVGQGMANSMMLARRYLAGGATESDVAVPPLFKSSLVWALFMGVSSNTRYQVVVGLERLVDVSVAKRVPQIAYFTTIVIRFVNNVIGGENFVDLARWAGVQ